MQTIKQILSFSIFLIFFSAILFSFFSYRFSAYTVLMLALIIILSFFINIITSGFKNKKQIKRLSCLFFSCLIFISILAFLQNMKIKNENKNPQTFTNVDDQAFINTNSQNSNQNLKSLENLKAQNLENSEAQDLNSYNIKNIDDALEKLNLKLQNKESRQELLNFLQSAEVYFISRQNKENPESFLDIGKIYEAAYVLGFLKDKKVVLNKYQEYCDVSIEKNKCNTYIEKFLLLDKNLK